jgi:hypothetical protein
MNLKSVLVLIFSFLISASAHANAFKAKYDQFKTDDFTESEVYELFQLYLKEGANNNGTGNDQLLIHAIKTPYAPAGSHAGAKFYEALSWYNDKIAGNRNGEFSLVELSQVFNRDAQKYINIVLQKGSDSDRIAAWKMLQKLTLLKNAITASGKNFYPYRANVLNQVNMHNAWNAANTIKDRADFEKRVIDASWQRPVLIKFGLTYCVHCLLMENLGSVPAVAKKYQGQMDVYKLWWNPKDKPNYAELNDIAAEEGITSSPMFNLYIDGKPVKSEYAFPDEQGLGLEEFLDGHL